MSSRLASTRSLATWMLLLLPAATCGQDLRNGGFEADGDEALAEWNYREALLGVPASAAYEVAPDTDVRHSGQRSARLRMLGQAGVSEYGRLRQIVAAEPFRGKHVRLTGWLRLKDVGTGYAGLFLRIDGADHQRPLTYDNMSSYGLTGSTLWTQCEIVLEVPPEAERLIVGASLYGAGAVWVDDLTLAVVPYVAASGEPPRPLAGRGLDNLTAFTRLLGYVRYFHPSDQAAAADWPAIAIHGMREIESADSPAALATAMTRVLRDTAPTVQVVVTGQEHELPPAVARAPDAAGYRVLAWRHQGCGLGTNQAGMIYSSERVDARGSGGFLSRLLGKSKDVDLPKPGQPLVKDLPGGVTCVVPLALYADTAGTIPHIPATKPADDQSTSAPSAAEEAPGVHRRESANDRAVRLADVALAWNVFQHFYPYFDVVKTDWDAALRDALTSAATDHDDTAFLTTLKRLVAALHDGHGRVSFASAAATGFLPLAWDIVEDRLVITAVDPEVATKNDLKVGDVVTSIDGQSAAKVIAEQEKLISAATPQWLRYRVCQDLYSGPQGASRELGIQRGNAPQRTVSLTFGDGYPWQLEGDARPAKIAEIRPGIWYVDIDRINDQDFAKAIGDLAQARGVIFDLRGYPNNLTTIVLRHLTDDTIQSAQWHVPIVTHPDRQQWTWTTSGWPVLPAKPRLTRNVAFIVNGSAISYAETYMGIVENYKLAAIIGEPTAGTNGNINPFSLPGGYTVMWTGMKVLKHDGSQHHGIGIRPTVPVKRTLAGVQAGRDELLERAIEFCESHAVTTTTSAPATGGE